MTKKKINSIRERKDRTIRSWKNQSSYSFNVSGEGEDELIKIFNPAGTPRL